MKTISKKSKIFLGFFLFILLFNACKKEDVIVTGVDLDQNQVSVQVGSVVVITPLITPVDATNKSIEWTSSDDAVATVVDGNVTGVSLGNAVITATSVSDPAIKAEATVEVTPATGQVITVSGDITTDTKWYATGKYLLSGFVYVKNNATLTIEPGTVIKGVSGSKAALIIERGSKIMAAGTAQNPIVFTSDKPKGSRAYGDWGGLVICGNAPTNKHDAGTGIGTAEGGIGSQYGGSNAADNSGVLQYVRIEFPGIPLTSTTNSEINGLTLYSVGSGTTIDHIQVSYSGDDSFEWFGGTANAKYLVAFRGWDDDFDTDNGFIGKVQFYVGIRDAAIADQSQSNGFESDNDAQGSTLSPFTAPLFVNGTLYGPLASPGTPAALYRNAMQIRRGSRTSVYNTVFVGWPQGLFIDGALGDSPAQATANVLQVENTVMAGMTTNFVTTHMTNAAAWFSDASRNNTLYASIGDLQIPALSLTSPNFLPNAGSPLLSGASFTNSRLADSFFTQVAYKGAFGSTNWTEGWCNFDPQNTDY